MKNIARVLFASYIIYIVIGVIQLVTPDFLVNLLNRATNEGGRGSISLANEPTYFSIQLILISLMLLLIDYEKYKFVMIVDLLVSLAIAQTMNGFVFSVCFFCVFTNWQKKDLRFIALYVSLAIGLMYFAIMLYIRFSPNSRFAFLFTNMVRYPNLIIEMDSSFRSRIVNFTRQIEEFIKNYMMPNGIYGSYISMLSGLLYEIGILSFPIFYFIIKVCKSRKRYLIIILILSLSSLNLTNPTFNMLLGFLFFKSNNERLEDVSLLEKL
ncbi:MAG: hypothetical protein LBT59_18735 [Clostridiales bacterium]|nr:hypothetical protein [Clostridiales bacterium]